MVRFSRALSTLAACLLSSSVLAQTPAGTVSDEPAPPAAPTPKPAPSSPATTSSPPGDATSTPDTAPTKPPPAPTSWIYLPFTQPPSLPGEPTESDYYDATLGNAVRRPLFSEERTPPGTMGAGATSSAIQFGLHGYFRAPLLLAWSRRSEDVPGQHDYNIRTPWLVDNDYYNSGFAYTPVNETDYTELFFMAGNRNVTATVAMMGSLYSDSAQPLLANQLGISQAYLTYRFFPKLKGVKARVIVKGGSFWDRFGYLPKYDTYLIGRTHQIGEQIRGELDVGKFTFSALQGFGVHLENIQALQGMTMINYLRGAVSYDKTLELGVYYANNWTQDERQLITITDASMGVKAIDVRASSKVAGELYVVGSIVDANEANFLAPSLELLDSSGGQGITQNYLGLTSSQNGSGDLYNFGFEYDHSLATLLHAVASTPEHPVWGDLKLSLFGMFTSVTSKQTSSDPTVNRNDIQYFKYGVDTTYWGLEWLGLGLRYDHVVMNTGDNADQFRIVSPRLSLRSHWLGEDILFLQYSHYFYGERIELRPGQVQLETQPDDNVVKIQAQMIF